MNGYEHADARAASKRTYAFAFAVLTVLVAVNLSNILRLSTYPFIDLPNHLAEAAILKYTLLNNSNIISNYDLRLSPFQPNILHAVFCSLFPDVETGNKIFYSLYVVLLPCLIFALIRMINGNPWFSLFSLPFLYNYSAMWGFTGYTLAIPLCILAFLVAVSQAKRPTPLKAVLLIIGYLIVYYTHILAFLFLLPLCILTAFTISKKARRHIWWSLLPSLPAASIFLIWITLGSEFTGKDPLSSFLLGYYKSEFLPGIARRFSDFFTNDNVAIARVEYGKLTALLLTLAIVLPNLLNWRQCLEAVNKVPERRALLVFVFFAVLCYAGLPDRLPEQPYLYPRYSVFVFLGLICFMSLIFSTRWRRLAATAAVLVGTLFSILWYQYFSEFQAWSSGISSVLRGASNNKTLSAIIDNAYYRDWPSLIHYNNYHIIRNQGVAVTSMTDYRFGFVRRSNVNKLPQYYEWINDGTDYPFLLSLYKQTDLMLIRGQRPREMLSQNTGWRVVAIAGEWALLENTSRAGDLTKEPAAQ